MIKKNAIPVLYYHSVADHSVNRPWSFLSCDINTFIKQMHYLKKKGYHTCGWDELYDHINGNRQLPKKTVMIQFDDGFLDNWVIVYPIMKKLNFKFSVLVTPEFIDNGIIREFKDKTLDSDIENWWGYLSKEELKKMHESGLVDIQAHGFTHTWYPVSDEIIDIYDGTQIEPWLYWNDNINDKPKWLTNGSLRKIPIGTPIFKYDKSLSTFKIFKPNKLFIEKCVENYDRNKTKVENIRMFNKIKKEFKDQGLLGEYETEEEAKKRLKKEIIGAKEYLENLLEKKIEFFVWPGGGNNDYVETIAFNGGYKLVSKGNKLNFYNSKIKKIYRVAGYHAFKPKILNTYLNVIFLKLQILRSNGNVIINLLFKLIKHLKKSIK